MKRALLYITDEYLRDALHLPDTVQIRHVSKDAADFSAGRVSIYLVGTEPTLPEVPEGYVAPVVTVELAYHSDEDPKFVRFVW